MYVTYTAMAKHLRICFCTKKQNKRSKGDLQNRNKMTNNKYHNIGTITESNMTIVVRV